MRGGGGGVTSLGGSGDVSLCGGDQRRGGPWPTPSSCSSLRNSFTRELRGREYSVLEPLLTQFLLVTLNDCDLPTLLLNEGGGVEGNGGGGLSEGERACREPREGVEKSRVVMWPPGLPDLNLLLKTGSST